MAESSTYKYKYTIIRISQNWQSALISDIGLKISLSRSVFQDLHVISTDENRVVAAVQEWNQNDTYNLYVSESGGVYYTLALENVMSSMGPEGNVMIDLYEVPV